MNLRGNLVLAALTFILLASSVPISVAIAAPVRCVPSAIQSFDDVLSQTFDFLETGYLGIGESSGEAQQLDREWSDISSFWEELQGSDGLSMEVILVAFSGEQLARTLAEINREFDDIQGRDFYEGMIYTALRRFNVALDRYGCPQDPDLT